MEDLMEDKLSNWGRVFISAILNSNHRKITLSYQTLQTNDEKGEMYLTISL